MIDQKFDHKRTIRGRCGERKELCAVNEKPPGRGEDGGGIYDKNFRMADGHIAGERPGDAGRCRA
jgi:hypothetical protein